MPKNWGGYLPQLGGLSSAIGGVIFRRRFCEPLRQADLGGAKIPNINKINKINKKSNPRFLKIARLLE